MKRHLTLTLLLVSALSLWGQQEPLYSNYLWHKLLLNPAYAGAREQLSIALQGRRQWAGFEGAPSTEALSLHFPSPDLRHGSGLSIVNDRWGRTSNLLIAANYAFRIPIGEEANLAFGMKAGLRSYRIRFSDIAIQSTDDAAFNNQVDFSRGQLVVAPGVYFQHKLFYAGASMSDLLRHKLSYPGGPVLDAMTTRHAFVMAGAAFPVVEAVKIRPTMLLRVAGGAPLGLDLGLAASYKDRIQAGAVWRPGNALALQLQAHILPSIYLGYAYDLSLNPTRTLGTGSHELLLGFDLNFLQLDIQSPSTF